jgi:hypothetical protein
MSLLTGLGAPFINVYPLDLNATEAQQATVSALRGLPASLKLIFGFMSDNFPLLGYRRKSVSLCISLKQKIASKDHTTYYLMYTISCVALHLESTCLLDGH